MKEGKKKKYLEKTSDDELQKDNQIQFARIHVTLLQLHNRLKTILVGCLTQCGRTCLKSLKFVVYAALKKLSQTSLLWKFPSNRSSDNAILTSTCTKEIKCNYKTLTTVLNINQIHEDGMQLPQSSQWLD